MNSRHLEHFVRVVELGSLTRAAAEGGITQSGLTKSLRTLEDTVGARLLERTARGVQPTPIGRALLRRASLVLSQIREAEAELGALREGAAGLLSIGAGPSWIRRCLPQACADLRRRVPDARLRVRAGFDAELIEGLRRGELDLVVAATPEGVDADGLTIRPLTEDVQSVVAAAGHALQGRGALALADLDDCDWVLPRKGMAQRQRFEAAWWTAGRAPPEPAAETGSVPFMLELAARSDLLTFATTGILASERMEGLVTLDVPSIRWRRRAGVVTRAGETPPLLADALIGVLGELCRTLDTN